MELENQKTSFVGGKVVGIPGRNLEELDERNEELLLLRTELSSACFCVTLTTKLCIYTAP